MGSPVCPQRRSKRRKKDSAVNHGWYLSFFAAPARKEQKINYCYEIKSFSTYAEAKEEWILISFLNLFLWARKCGSSPGDNLLLHFPFLLPMPYSSSLLNMCDMTVPFDGFSGGDRLWHHCAARDWWGISRVLLYSGYNSSTHQGAELE